MSTARGIDLRRVTDDADRDGPKSAHRAAKKRLAESWDAEDSTHARTAARAFEPPYGAKYPKVVDAPEELLAFYDFPAEYRRHLRTTNPIESTFAAVRHHTGVTKGPGSRAVGLAMGCGGAPFERGVLVQRDRVSVA